MKLQQSSCNGVDARFAITVVVCGLMCGFASEPVQGQGEIWYTIRNTPILEAHVYGPEVSDPTRAKMGNTATETPAGTQTYEGARLEGSGWSAQLFAALGSGQPESSLMPVAASLTTFRTGSVLGGTIAPSIIGVPNILPGQIGTFQLRVWIGQRRP